MVLKGLKQGHNTRVKRARVGEYVCGCVCACVIDWNIGLWILQYLPTLQKNNYARNRSKWICVNLDRHLWTPQRPMTVNRHLHRQAFKHTIYTHKYTKLLPAHVQHTKKRAILMNCNNIIIIRRRYLIIYYTYCI